MPGTVSDTAFTVIKNNQHCPYSFTFKYEIHDFMLVKYSETRQKITKQLL